MKKKLVALKNWALRALVLTVYRYRVWAVSRAVSTIARHWKPLFNAQRRADSKRLQKLFYAQLIETVKHG
jgi:hypothetical protein